MLKSVLLNAIVLSAVLTASSSQARDLGAIGPTHDIEETSLLTVIKQRITNYLESGQYEREKDLVKKRAKRYATRPLGRVLPRARTYRAHDVSLAFTLSADIKDADGKILFPSGTPVDPLAYHIMNDTLCFIDADDPEQIEWLTTHCPVSPTSKAILINGDYPATAQALGRRLYFDQRGYLVGRFSIEAVPAIVRQKNKVLHVQQFPIN